MTASTPNRGARSAQPTSDVVSIRDFLLRRATQAELCPLTQRIRASAATLPVGTSPDETDAMIRAHLSTFAN